MLCSILDFRDITTIETTLHLTMSLLVRDWSGWLIGRNGLNRAINLLQPHHPFLTLAGTSTPTHMCLMLRSSAIAWVQS
jgi:hypothetical protein